MAESGKRRFGLDSKESWWEDPLPNARDQGPGGPRWPVMAVVILLPFLIPVTRSLMHEPEVTPGLVLTAVVVYAYAACYALFPFFFRRERRVKLVFGIVMNALGLASLVAASGSAFVLLYGTAVLVFLLPAAWSVILDLATVAVGAVILLADGRFQDGYGDLITVCSITLAMFFMANLVRAVRRLELANEEIATLAVANERERLARDLHDLLGHSLTTITVKAGLARRVLESAGDIPRAVEEIREVENLTRSALSDVRATVSANREVSLSVELVGARAALRAAEIDADLPHAVDNVRPEFQNAFGYVLREAVTNVLRHSGAKRVRVRLGDNWLEIEDDGTATDVVAGNGLRGLSERLAAVGGTVQTSVRPRGGLLVRAEIPLPEPSPATPAVRAEPAGGLA
ncbi:two-component system histidine kinase [Amycolatopsis mediterranei S699]|uniref:Two-component system histidine kinase n=2 Tax=Amycolatopsis mediterranei TaxID=33910 RepID=A0A0H3DDN0_AMYMU|nr:sensor histidine kinase [Amycolatopsis mediterranei]ADJ48327.1 two-component system histidine kinase [Amycolatopsis mediterranei U32]AEK45247.1 two-component system histidine kinase [Amycolatopsis mediterranei S699]AFO80038.1 two-component system histidine kinase [Amycolatopsis mediterranei S699]AGT87166.1 two-component system histidine kinase [Amycolatopsis mediterranei RB]KDO10846.1 histidine kinase [Amycolatopsis mediterranei]